MGRSAGMASRTTLGLRLVSVALAAAATLAGQASGAGPRVDARAWLLENAATGEVLASNAARERVPIASITKLMTVLVALERSRLDEAVAVDPRAAAVGESSLGLRPGERVLVRDLVRGALIQSANDAAWALAYHAGEGDAARFVAAMNAKARRLGMTDTRFVRPDGLDVPGHVSSARDVHLLTRAAMRRAVVRRTGARRRAVAAGRTLHGWNDLLGRFPGLLGVKTGHTGAAGWSQVALVRRGPLRLYATVLGSPTRDVRNAELARLLRWGLSRYRRVEAVSGDRVYARAAAPYGRPAVPLVARRPLVRLLRVDRPLVERVVARTAAQLPLRRGEVLGEVRVYDRGKLIGHRDLVAARSLSRPDLAGRVRWYAGRTIGELRELLP